MRNIIPMLSSRRRIWRESAIEPIYLYPHDTAISEGAAG